MFQNEKLVFDGDATFRKVTQDIDPVLELNKMNRENINTKSPFERLGRIPMVLYREWMEKYGLKYPPTPECTERLMTLLKKAEFSYLRTGGKI